MLFHTTRDLFIPELYMPICGWDGNMQGTMHLPNPMRLTSDQQGRTWMPVDGTLSVSSNLPSWTIDSLTKQANICDTDIYSGFIGGSSALQMWFDWSQYHYTIPKNNCIPCDIDWHFVPLWIPHEYPLGRFPEQDRILVFNSHSPPETNPEMCGVYVNTGMNEGDMWIQPLVETLAYEWTRKWWERPGFINKFDTYMRNELLVARADISHYRYEQILMNNSIMRFWKRPGVVNICNGLHETWSRCGRNGGIQSIRQYYFFLQKIGQNIQTTGEVDIHWTRPITLNTSQLLQPGANPSHSLWINIYSPRGIVMPLQTPARLVRGFINQIDNIFTAAKQHKGGKLTRVKKVKKSIERLRMFFKWRESLLPFSHPGDWIEQTLMRTDDVDYWSKITRLSLYNNDISDNPVQAMQITSSWINELTEMDHPLTNHSI